MDEDEVDRLLWELGLELPDVEDDEDGDGLPPRLDQNDWEGWG